MNPQNVNPLLLAEFERGPTHSAKMNKEHVIIYSHGFGVKKDDRGLFTDIAAALPETIPVMFDYGNVDEKARTIAVVPLKTQVALLKKRVAEIKQEYPSSIIDIVAHSQGSVVAAMAADGLDGIRKILMLAPPPDLDIETRVEKYGQRPGAKIDINGISLIPGSDGYLKIIPSAYWESLRGVEPIKLYNLLSRKALLIIVEALHDEIIEPLPSTSFESGVETKKLDADHNFKGNARKEVIELIKQELSVI